MALCAAVVIAAIALYAVFARDHAAPSPTRIGADAVDVRLPATGRSPSAEAARRDRDRLEVRADLAESEALAKRRHARSHAGGPAAGGAGPSRPAGGGPPAPGPGASPEGRRKPGGKGGARPGAKGGSESGGGASPDPGTPVPVVASPAPSPAPPAPVPASGGDPRGGGDRWDDDPDHRGGDRLDGDDHGDDDPTNGRWQQHDDGD